MELWQQHAVANTSYSFSAFPQMQRSCTVDPSFHGNSDPTRLFVWSLTPSVQTLLYTGLNSTESGPKVTKINQAVTVIHPFLRVTQCKCFLIEFPDAKYKINTKNQLQKHRGCKCHKARGVRVYTALFPELPCCPGLTPTCTWSLWGCQD